MFQGRRLCGPSGQTHTQCEHGGGVHKTVTEASCQIPGTDAASADKGRCDGFQPATAAKASQRTARCGCQCWSFNLDHGTPWPGPSWLSYVSTSFWRGICGPGCWLWLQMMWEWPRMECSTVARGVTVTCLVFRRAVRIRSAPQVSGERFRAIWMMYILYLPIYQSFWWGVPFARDPFQKSRWVVASAWPSKMICWVIV